MHGQGLKATLPRRLVHRSTHLMAIGGSTLEPMSLVARVVPLRLLGHSGGVNVSVGSEPPLFFGAQRCFPTSCLSHVKLTYLKLTLGSRHGCFLEEHSTRRRCYELVRSAESGEPIGCASVKSSSERSYNDTPLQSRQENRCKVIITVKTKSRSAFLELVFPPGAPLRRGGVGKQSGGKWY